MPLVEPELAPLQIPRLAALATSPWPAWLWLADGSRMAWTNAVGAAVFGAGNVSEAGGLRFAADAPAAQILRLAATLPASGSERLERLRGFGAGFGGALMCACSRLVLPDGATAVLIAATEPAGPSLPLAERMRRLLPDGAGALAAFTPDGMLLHANAAARQRLGGAMTLAALGLEALGARALEAGHASSASRAELSAFEVTAMRLGRDDSRVLLLALPPPSGAVAVAPNAGNGRARAQAAAAVGATAAPNAAKSPAARQATPAHELPAQRRHPLRFVWQMDADGRFVVGSDEFIELVGPRTIAACGRPWSQIAAELKLDPDNQVGRAVATRETWSGIVISWPVDNTSERLPVELSGLPVFDRDRAFGGYRGFGVCRDIERIHELARARRERPIGFVPAPDARVSSGGAAAPQNAIASAMSDATAPLQAETAEPAKSAPAAAAQSARAAGSAPGATANVVPFRAGAAPEPRPPSLSPVERSAFRELAQELTARLRGGNDEAPPAADIQPAPGTADPAAAQVAAEVAPLSAPDSAETHDAAAPPQPPPAALHAVLDRVPAGVLIHRKDSLLYANRHFLELCDYDSLEALAAAGGLSTLFAEPGGGALADSGGAQKLSIVTQRGDKIPVEGRLFSIPWNGASALALILTGNQAEERERAAQLALASAQNEVRDLQANLDRTARREAQKAAAAKADFLAKVSHEIRTPLNSMIGFAEVIMAERFGAIGNARYREYLKDMHAAGTHLVSLLNDLLDLSKIETGQLDLTFADLDLNDLTQQCVGVMQPQANNARIIIRTALTPALPHAMADARSVRQIVLNLLGNAIKFTGPGGQVIVSTAVADGGEAVLRVRDTGVGMREADIEAALEPFRQSATSASWGSGAGLSLPLTKALAEVNRAKFSIKSAPNAGTLIEISFPSSRMAAG